MVVLDGMKVPINMIERIDKYHVYTKDYMKISPYQEEMDALIEKILLMMKEKKVSLTLNF